jgi:AcrR family transcriptional regulator
MEAIMTEREDPRVTRTRKLIQDAFIELANEKGFDAVSIKDISARATINRATFYAHYEDKFALLTDMTRLAFEQRISERVPKAETLNESACRELIAVTLDYLTAFYKTCRIDRENVAGLIDKTAREVLERAVAKLTDTEMAAAIISAAIYGAAEFCYKTQGGADTLMSEASKRICGAG